ncbi:glycerophosphodiester phosphodiesterase family protein [Nakamurella aerolata]|uniref:Glycerophosphodiester phosphodiesterase n=1 Tax=Nakamurella aerolata TaxID=1656892 RepID=A0A849A7B2_9ACTN|nr:glycerophosphodiester phosphodiesterase [Nakamurella aerolata]
MSVRTIAHRGAWGDPAAGGPVENTVEAVQAAIAAGADMVEIDVRLTADGAPMLLHDDTLERIWGREEPIEELTRAQVRKLPSVAGQRIPDLAEVVELADGAGAQLMVDLPREAAGPVAHEAIRKLGALDGALFAGQTKALRAHSASARIALSWYQLEEPTEELLAERAPEFFNPHYRLLHADLADRMHARGLRVSVWTVDHPRDMAAAYAQGADAITSNRIADLVQVAAAVPAATEPIT